MKSTTSRSFTAHPHLPERLQELWHWFVAVYVWDWGESYYLAELIRREPIPPEFQTAVADIIDGERKQKKGKLSPGTRFQIGEQAAIGAEIRNVMLSDFNDIERMGDEMGVDPDPITRTNPIIGAIQKKIRERNKSLAKEAGICLETVRIIRRDWLARIGRWPVV